MGGCCSAQMSCAFGPSPASLCCRSCPRVKESTSTRIMYIFFVVIAFIMACLMLSPQVYETILSEYPTLNVTCVNFGLGVDCSHMTGYMGVYRLFSGMVFFHVGLMIITMCVRSSDGWRAEIHNGYWIFKFLILAGVCFGALFLPSRMQVVWMYIGMAGGFVFLLLQLILLVDFAHSWNAKWTGRPSKGNYRSCSCGIFGTVVFAFLFYVATAVGFAYVWLSYTALNECLHNKIFIGVNVGLCILLSFVTLLPCTQSFGNPNAGFLQSSLISLYVTYLTWSALSSEPLEGLSIETTFFSQSFGPVALEKPDDIFKYSINSTLCSPLPKVPHQELISAYAGLVLTLLMALYASVTTSSDAHKLGIPTRAPSFRAWLPEEGIFYS